MSGETVLLNNAHDLKSHLISFPSLRAAHSRPGRRKTMASMDTDQLSAAYAFAVQLGKDAGNMLMDAAWSRVGPGGQTEQAAEEKESAVDIVTKTDEGILCMRAVTSLYSSCDRRLTCSHVLGGSRGSLHQELHRPEIPRS